MDSHSSRPCVAAGLKQPTRERRGPRHGSPIWPCSRWGLPCRSVARLAVRSYRTVSPLPRMSCDTVRRSALCCTFRRLAPPRRYLAPCPVEPGLSSARERDAAAWPAPAASVPARRARTPRPTRHSSRLLPQEAGLLEKDLWKRCKREAFTSRKVPSRLRRSHKTLAPAKAGYLEEDLWERCKRDAFASRKDLSRLRRSHKAIKTVAATEKRKHSCPASHYLWERCKRDVFANRKEFSGLRRFRGTVAATDAFRLRTRVCAPRP